MSLIVINLRRAEDRRDVVHRAVQTLAEGKLVVFPTETEYCVAAAARSAVGVQRLLKWRREALPTTDAEPLCLAIRGVEDAWDYVPRLQGVALRLARRCWPGPVTLALAPDGAESLVRQLTPEVRTAVMPDGELWLRAPGHPVVLEVLQMLAGPLALSPVLRSGSAETASGETAAARVQGVASLLLDDGACRYGQAATVVRADERSCRCLREGVVPPSALERLASMLIVLVCTGNTCRSPMAEALLRRLLSERLGCQEGELGQRGIQVASAGIAAASGGKASPEAVAAMQQRGLDISCHASQPLTENLVRDADLILTLTSGHRHAIVARWPEAAERVATLRADEGDIDDPIGAPPAVYRLCADQIEEALRQRVAGLNLTDFVDRKTEKE